MFLGILCQLQLLPISMVRQSILGIFRICIQRFRYRIQILVILTDGMCGDPVLDLLYVAIPTALLGVGAFFMMGKDGRKKIEKIFR